LKNLKAMIDGVKLIECRLTPPEWEAIKIIRAEDIEFGQITFHVYYQHGKIIRIEGEKVIKSKTIKS